MQGANSKLLNFDASQTTYFKFWAKGSSDAIITLVPNTTTISQNRKRYEVVIGGSSNSITWIWRQGPWTPDDSPHVPGYYLTPEEYNPFWLSWANRNITLGLGHRIGMNVLTFKDTSNYPNDTNFIFVRSHGSYTVQFKYGYYNGRSSDHCFAISIAWQLFVLN